MKKVESWVRCIVCGADVRIIRDPETKVVALPYHSRPGTHFLCTGSGAACYYGQQAENRPNKA